MLYGIQEFFSIRELVAEIKEVFGIEVKMPEEELEITSASGAARSGSADRHPD